MIGKYTLEIGWKEFLDGMTSSPETEDGGFSPQSANTNITSTQDRLGLLYASANLVDKSTSLNGNIIAAVSDPDSGIGISKYILTSTGRFISADSSSVLTVRRTSAGAKTYSFPNSDIVVYKNALYATSSNDITKATGANLATTFDESWWDTTEAESALSTGVRHPMIVYEDSLWIGDGNLLHKYDGSISTSGFLTLNTGLVIIALGIDPSTGKMLISASEGANGSDTLPRQCKIYVWDGFSQKPSRAVIVDDMVTEIYPLGGVVYMFYGQNIGYWNGSGITFLRRLKSAGLSGTELVYKHRVTNIGKTMYVADGRNVFAMEDTIPGKRAWYIAHNVNSSFNTYLDAIFSMGNNVLGIAYDSNGSTPQFHTFDRSAITTGSFNFYSKKYKFPRPIYVREFHIEYYDSVAASATSGVATLYDQNFSAIATPALTNDSTSATYSITRPINSSKKIRTLQLYYTNSSYSSVIAGIRRFVITYDVVE